MGFLREEDDGAVNMLLEDVLYKDRDFVLIDESHNLRHRDTQRYKVVEAFLSTGRRCCFLTATPRNKSAWDVYSQIKLFHPDDKTDLPVDPPDLKQYFKLIEDGERKLPDLLANILIRRARNHILRWYGFDSETHQQVDASQFRDYLDGRKRAYVIVGGRHQFFPKRELDTIEYSIEDTYRGLYQELRGYMGTELAVSYCEIVNPSRHSIVNHTLLWPVWRFSEPDSFVRYTGILGGWSMTPRRRGSKICLPHGRT
jgi:hypothetical protein